MKSLLAALAGFALIGAVGATQVNAQGVRIDINKGNKRVVVDTTRSSSEGFRRPHRVEKQATGHYITVEKKVWVPGHYITKTERVFVPAKHIDVRERRVDRHGCVYYVTVCKIQPAHYKDVCRQVFVPGCYEIRTERVWVEADCEPAHGHGHAHGNDHGAVGHGQDKKGKKRNRGRSGRGR